MTRKPKSDSSKVKRIVIEILIRDDTEEGVEILIEGAQLAEERPPAGPAPPSAPPPPPPSPTAAKGPARTVLIAFPGGKGETFAPPDETEKASEDEEEAPAGF